MDSFPKQEGAHSRQARADFPEQAMYEREAVEVDSSALLLSIMRTDRLVDWQGPLRPRAFDFNQLKDLTKKTRGW